MLEFVDSGLHFVQDENNFINPLLQVGSGGPKITGFDRIRILIPGYTDHYEGLACLNRSYQISRIEPCTYYRHIKLIRNANPVQMLRKFHCLSKVKFLLSMIWTYFVQCTLYNVHMYVGVQHLLLVITVKNMLFSSRLHYCKNIPFSKNI